MPQNNPGREGLDGGEAVFIDAPSLKDFDALVNFNIPSSELESFRDGSEHVVGPTGVLMSDGVNVANMIDSSSKETMMDTSDSTHSSSAMDVDTLPDAGHILGDISLLQQPQDLIPISGQQDIITESVTSEQLSATSSNHILTSTSLDASNANLVLKDNSQTAGETQTQAPVMKTSVGQFVILQQNQGGIQLGSLAPGRIFQANNTISSVSNNFGAKSVVVNANHLGSGIKQIGNFSQNQPQFRTVQLKQPISLPQSQNAGNVTKVIINSQTANNLGSQFRLISTQPNVSLPTDAVQQNDMDSPSKVTLLQQIAISLPSSKTVLPTNAKVLTGFPSGSSSTKVVSAPLSPTHKLLVKGNISLSNVQSNSQLKPGQIFATTGVKIAQQQLPNKMNYVRLVNPSSSNSTNLNAISSHATLTTTTTTLTTSHTVTKAPIATKPIAPATVTQNVKIKGLSIPAHQTNSKQRLIIPLSNNSQSVSNMPIRPQGSITIPASALPPGVLSNAQPGSLVMIPAHYFQNSANSSTSNPTAIRASSVSPPVPSSVASAVVPSKTASQPHRTVIDANGIKPRKPCNCTKSQCLKLYCDCFANGEFCNNCNCANCYNNLTHEEDRQKAIRTCLERNPQAFRPKIGKGGTESERRHNKGCNCKRSGCLKNYCECYEAKIPCSNMCKCIGCRNIDNCQVPERKKLLHLAEAAESSSRVNQKALLKSRPAVLSSLPSPAKMSLSANAKSSYCRINQEVVEATCQCLLAQAEMSEKSSSNENVDLLVIKEFSRCLLQIIGCSAKNSSRSDGVS